LAAFNSILFKAKISSRGCFMDFPVYI
jgi:hypothetical protein